ncbi:preprotein translocase subunit YajC [Andreprevotia lacus DSM 23236]|jgi:preprotein translocase subunit YajC|uniref:Sec translocon accessory complex subunit YajC n=1 Tax=Andreprevotia lacus DSM 23236 TaxID=1121001 RepID=A0A1W1XKI1_9NEIS|nr:preprotein translocase subunit YajC [Andreprevotia lacus]SMC24327.1 preprotein translocase subunit YajC [Andreprevotia lacus DSM 23236]
MFINTAYAADGAAAASPAGGIVSFLPMVVIFVLFYFMLIRPQQKKAKEAKAMIDALDKGDEVVTVGGIVGKITKAGETYLTLELSAGVEILVQRSAVSQRLEKGTLKNNK